ncbi:YceI family protein [Olleya aquimaris]|uniref:YceI-like domain-containing protein n=1 Tax=Olleya aquimaris TaxID=639310 RepID=A0A327RLU7_9FLAO|nr:YceI family protein [Olleya aquimaris]RAJ16912.1 YceI-like domain-containing protein [Olleya aquimaris]
MKTVLTLIMACILSVSSIAQDKYLTKTGQITFEASVPSFEEVKAKNEATTVILNTENGEFAALVFVKAFRFKNALMEEHFNENYAESDTYPKANFKGKISDFDFDSLNTTNKKMLYSGTLEFHGKTNTLTDLPMTISKNEAGQIVLSGTFSVNVDDFDIEIPKVVSNKLSKTVDVAFSFTLKKK